MSLRRPTTERQRENKNYNVYCINFYGSGLNSIKDEFKRQLQTGLRRSVFVLDLQDVQQELDSQPRTTKQRKDYMDNPANQLMTLVVQAIQNFRTEYDVISRKINEELKFDLYQYWLKDIEDKQKASLIDTASLKDRASLNIPVTGKSSIKDQPKTAKSTKARKKSMVKMNPPGDYAQDTVEVVCVNTIVKEHNRVGQPEMLSKRKYIKDDPPGGKLYIIIIGHMDEQFYLDLLRRDQPVQGIVHFLPAESNYDILLNNNQLRTFIMETLESLYASIYRLRQGKSMKPVGLFNHDLPVISTCLAAKHQTDIYDQLTWAVYDIELLQQQYQAYYYRPFQETDVALPEDVDLQQLYTVAESLRVQGHFQKNALPGSSSDMATIMAYLDSLLTTCGLPENILNDKEIESMADPKLPKSNLIKSYSFGFGSITKIRKFERLFLEETNRLLNNMLLYADQVRVKNIYLCCLDYNLWRQYVTTPYLRESKIGSPLTHNKEALSLPGFIKIYTTEDSCGQKISELLSAYDDYHIDEIDPRCKIYTFRRTYNVVFEDERMVVIPTRLCFRDFTLFQREEFLENLVTPEMRKAAKEEAKRSSLAKGGVEKKMKMIDLDENIFVRPNSLKALKLLSEKESEHSQTQRENEVRSSRHRSRQYDKKPSVNINSRLSQEWVGLPPGHGLIKGYNLEDIRQEIKVKTSKYFYEHGCIQLYEEKWCFQDMNKELTLTINDCSIFFNRPRHQAQGISKNIRLQAKNNVNIRILNEPQECARVIMNYPNGLAIYYHDMHCEQEWFSEESLRDEQRRICTPYGAVMVFYKAQHMILVMRYNGEVYKLYQYELPEEEEEQDMLSEFSDNQSSEFNDTKAQGDGAKENVHSKPESYVKGTVQGHGDNKNKRCKTNFARLRQNPHEPKQRTSDESVKIKISSSPTSIMDDLKAYINDELRFLNYISAVYELSYLHLVVTTSQGRRINLTQNGKIFEGKPCKVQEWHDYSANESYCQRSDGVKMVWTHDSLKCYHRDGSVLTSRTEEEFDPVNMDEFESQISESSSHDQMEEEGEEFVAKSRPRQSTQMEDNLSVPVQLENPNYSDYLAAEGTEEIADAGRYLCYTCSSWLMQHHHYAGVYIEWLKPSSLTQPPSVFMKIMGIDEICIYTVAEDGDEVETPSLKTTTSEGEEDHRESFSLLVNVCVGDNLHLTVDREYCEIYAVMERQSEEEAKMVCDSLTLRLLFKDCLADVFKYLVNEIATIPDNNGPKTEELYYVQRIGQHSKVKGFEFLKCLPKIRGYSNTASNCTLEVTPLRTTNELMTHTYEWFDKDMKKFPRFPAHKTKKTFIAESDFPKVCSTSVYCKVPSLFQNTKHIAKFLEPFENIHFKTLRRKMKQFLDIYLRPQLQLDVKSVYSSNNWLKRHREHERRKFTERQRMGLYHAMLKHCMYPNYYKFTHSYEGHVRYIDFFDFMQLKCPNNEVKREEVYWDIQNKWCNSKSKRSRSNTIKHKCKYGNYDK